MELALQLLASTVLIILVTIVHGTGVTLSGKLFNYEEMELDKRRLAFRELFLMVPMALFLFALHAIEIGLFAAFYLAVGAIGTVEEALFVSASSYSTLGHTEYVAPEWRLVGAFEGLAGFLMIGWSAAVFVSDMDKVLRR